MIDLFLFGTLCYEPLLNHVLGREADKTPARLRGFRSALLKGQSFPILVKSEGVEAHGVLVRGLAEADLDRLNYYEAAFEFDLQTHEVQTETGPISAQVYFPVQDLGAPGEDWDLDNWARDWGDLTLMAAEEVMRGYGKESAASIARRFPIIRARAQSHLRAMARRRPVTRSSALTREDVVIDTHLKPYENFFTVSEFHARFRRFDGGTGQTGQRAIFNAADAVTVLPYDPVRDRVMLIEQLRMGALSLGDPQPWLLEPIAGIVDLGESYEEAAYREAVEEAHVELSALHHVAGYYPTPGGVAQYLISYIGIADLPDDARRIGGVEAEGENIRNMLVPFEELMQMLQAGELVNAPLILSCQWLALHRAELRGETGLSA